MSPPNRYIASLAAVCYRDSEPDVMLRRQAMPHSAEQAQALHKTPVISFGLVVRY